LTIIAVVATNITDPWNEFVSWTGTLADLNGTGALLGWDRETGMPPRGAQTRARQMGTIAGLHHREMVRPDIDDVLAALGQASLDAEQTRAVAVATRARRRAMRMPESLVRELSEARSRCVTVWLEARPRADYPAFAEALRAVVALKRQEAQAVGDGGEPYDALLEEFEPGLRAKDLEPIFADLRARIAPLVAAAHDVPPAPDLSGRVWPAAAQVALAHDLGALVGFDASGGMIALSAHPFTSSPGFGDVRFSTRVNEADPVGNILAVMHEAGHALYEQGFPERYARGVLLDAPSLGAHESQSRFWENHIGRTAGFWRHIAPLLRAHFPEAMVDLEPQALFQRASSVQPSLIRVDADEVTYNLHIALRFEIELALIRGDLDVDELPTAWDDRMHEMLGVRPPSAADGVMQDIHWAEGLIGYFPTYTIGNLYAAQLAETADATLGGLEAAIEAGRFTEILAFMRDRVHCHGRDRDTPEMMRAATGKDLSADALVGHLSRVVQPPS
jgi:carboxypeptidase Taq